MLVLAMLVVLSAVGECSPDSLDTIGQAINTMEAGEKGFGSVLPLDSEPPQGVDLPPTEWGTGVDTADTTVDYTNPNWSPAATQAYTTAETMMRKKLEPLERNYQRIKQSATSATAQAEVATHNAEAAKSKAQQQEHQLMEVKEIVDEKEQELKQHQWEVTKEEDTLKAEANHVHHEEQELQVEEEKVRAEEDHIKQEKENLDQSAGEDLGVIAATAASTAATSGSVAPPVLPLSTSATGATDTTYENTLQHELDDADKEVQEQKESDEITQHDRQYLQHQHSQAELDRKIQELTGGGWPSAGDVPVEADLGRESELKWKGEQAFKGTGGDSLSSGQSLDTEPPPIHVPAVESTGSHTGSNEAAAAIAKAEKNAHQTVAKTKKHTGSNEAAAAIAKAEKSAHQTVATTKKHEAIPHVSLAELANLRRQVESVDTKAMAHHSPTPIKVQKRNMAVLTGTTTLETKKPAVTQRMAAKADLKKARGKLQKLKVELKAQAKNDADQLLHDAREARKADAVVPESR